MGLSDKDNNLSNSTKSSKGLKAFFGLFKSNKNLLITAIVVLVVVTVLAVSGGLLAKYISENKREAEMISSGFHLSSNYLKETRKYLNVATSGEIQVELYNWELENTAQVSEMDILYQVNVSGGNLTSVTLNDTSTEVTASGGKYNLALGTGADHKTKHVLHITPLASADSVMVWLHNTEPYAKNGTAGLSAQFTKTIAADPVYSIAKYDSSIDDVWLVTIKTNGYSGDIKVKCNIAPDNTNNSMTAWTTSSTQTLAVHDNETYELLFFGSASAVSETVITSPSTTGITVG